VLNLTHIKKSIAMNIQLPNQATPNKIQGFIFMERQ
jgi:hypothetical protein